jgi:hypothetical protein
MNKRAEGGCLCGRVRYVADGAPIDERVCHCRLCQKALGSPFYGRIKYRAEDVAVAGGYATVNSSDALKRGFCPNCGTTLFSIREAARQISVTVGSLDDPSIFTPDMHIWVSSKQPWVRLDDGLPQYPEGLPT